LHDTGENLSDHCPLRSILNLNVKNLHISDSLFKTAKRRYKMRWDKADLLSYYTQSGSLLKSIVTPVALLHCSVGCQCDSHKLGINQYYNNIVNMLTRSTAGCVPKIPHNCLKPYWSDDLDRLKMISIDMHNLWRMVGSPRQGVINAARLTAKLDYKHAVKQAALNFEQNNVNELDNLFADKRPKDFWRCWNSKFKKSLSQPVTIEGQSDPAAIADTFKHFYANVYVDSSSNDSSVHEFNNAYLSMPRDKCDDRIVVDVDTLERCLRSLKCNKAASFDGIMSEHIIYSHPVIVLHLKFLFSMMLNHSYVPAAFGQGIVIPILKDRHGDLGSVDNYRPITISPVISKVFELLLLEKHANALCTDNLQFGFKTGLGCNNAIFALRQCVEYFNERNSNVYIASLDASKAFDRVNHYKLFTTLIQTGLPKYFVDTLINWYSQLSVSVRWNGFDSSLLFIKSGVRQGGILSPILFNVYVNCMLIKLRKLDLGCHIEGIFIGCIMYADDLLLISASIIDLQLMLDSCNDTGAHLGINFNSKKSNCLLIGPNRSVKPEPLCINNAPIFWSDKIKYLGVTIMSCKRFTVDFSDARRKFFASVNSILSKCSLACDMVKLDLLEKHCLPILLYVIESLNIKNLQLKELNSWWNSVYRKIFAFNKWESVKELISLSGRLDLLHIVNMRQLIFTKRQLLCTNDVISALMIRYVRGPELFKIQNSFSNNIHYSDAKIKALTFISFKASCVLAS
jgi:hypothetical protein